MDKVENTIYQFVLDECEKQGFLLFEFNYYQKKNTHHVEISIDHKQVEQYYFSFSGNQSSVSEYMQNGPLIDIEHCESFTIAVRDFAEMTFSDLEIKVTVSSPGMFRHYSRTLDFVIMRHFLLKIYLQGEQGSTPPGGERGFAADIFLLENGGQNDGVNGSKQVMMPFLKCADYTEMEKVHKALIPDYQQNIVQDWSRLQTDQKKNMGLVYFSLPVHQKWDKPWQNVYDYSRSFWQEHGMEIQEQLSEIYNREGIHLYKSMSQHILDKWSHWASQQINSKNLLKLAQKVKWSIFSIDNIKKVHTDYVLA